MLSLDENQIYLYTSSLSGILDIRSNQTFILFTYGEMWLLKKISCEIQILNEKVGKLMIENSKLEQENKKLRDRIDELEKCNLNLQERLDRKEELNKRMREEIKDHQLYEEKLEHRIIEFEELLHGE